MEIFCVGLNNFFSFIFGFDKSAKGVVQNVAQIIENGKYYNMLFAKFYNSHFIIGRFW